MKSNPFKADRGIIIGKNTSMQVKVRSFFIQNYQKNHRTFANVMWLYKNKADNILPALGGLNGLSLTCVAHSSGDTGDGNH